MLRHKTLLPLYFVASLSYASCGSTFCTVNTNWDTQGLSNDAGLLVDLRYSYAKADQWRAGTSKKATETPSGSNTEIEDKRTINQLVNLNLDYALNQRWSIMLGVPVVMRDHQHTFDSDSGAFTQQAKFQELGDIRVLGKYKFHLDSHDAGAGLRFGLKLPTGSTNQTMTPPDPADPGTPYKLERSSQPGSGSSDGLLGFYYFQNTPGNGLGWFANAQLQSAITTKDNYRPGNEVNLDLGMHYEVMEKLNLLLQLNSLYRARDTGANANPASGGYSIHLSPGASYAVALNTQVYGFIQLPLAFYLNTDPADSASGQLAARWAASIGISQRF